MVLSQNIIDPANATYLVSVRFRPGDGHSLVIIFYQSLDSLVNVRIFSGVY